MKRFLTVLTLLTSLSLYSQNERVRLMDYNLLYYRASSAPCSQSFTPSQRDQKFKEIVKYVNPDILVVNEMGANSSNPTFIRDFVLNTDGVTKYAHANFSNNSFSSIVNMIFYDASKVALFNQDAISKDLSNNDLVRLIDVYTFYYKDPKLAVGADTIFFTVIAAHLKAGNSSTDAAKRSRATAALMGYLDNNLHIENVIFTGDLNLYTASETAYQNMLNYSTTSERLFDPLNASGSWNNNSSFANIHTQSTHSSSSGCFSSGGMDDRFDFFLISDEILNGQDGISYVPNSYVAVGQDGNHFNSSINSGGNSAVPSTIADALYEFSDHLPITMQIDIAQSNIGIDETWVSEEILYNNPVTQTLNIEFNRPSQQDIYIKLFDLRGKALISDLMKSGSKDVIINTSTLAPGIYILHFADVTGRSFTRKIVKD